ncbi:putative FBD-associated F-box protein At5g56400 [Sorghum bicolor]|nr:putative FBD-associated F-box protein At5g56400 [Sorghum bicolor]|eukprot:XP_021319324.1 putative FBD-associated F-box protein At5g56400 [Sorghum bicolor]
MGVRSRSKSKRRRRATTSAGAGGVVGGDLISSLTDDLLVRILDLLPETRDAVRTHALSRRWRGLWTGVSALRFDSGSWPAAAVRRDETSAAEQYLAFVDDALTLRAKATTTTRCYAIEDLKISLDISDAADHKTEELLLPRSLRAAQGWIRYAVQHEVKSLALNLYLPWRYVDHRLPKEEDDDEKVDFEMALLDDDLASSATKLETMNLSLGGVKLRLPSSSSTVVFSSLTDVSLEDITVKGHLLSRLVSPPCCPRLRKLHLTDLRFSTMEGLLLEGDALLELSIDSIENMQSLELRTPSLRVLHVQLCSDLEGFTVSAPRVR